MQVTLRLRPAPVADWTSWFLNLTYWPTLLALPFSKSDRLDFELYVILICGYVANVFWTE